MNRRQAAAVVGIGLGFGTLWGQFLAWAGRREVTTSRLSPDETLRAWLTEPKIRRPMDPDRVVKVGLDRVATGKLDTLLINASRPVGGPAGSERFVWSRDGSKLLLVGRHFFVRDDLLLATGDQAYFLHDLKAGRSWINAADDDRFPPLTADLIAGVDWAEPVVLKPRAKVDPDSPANPE